MVWLALGCGGYGQSCKLLHTLYTLPAYDQYTSVLFTTQRKLFEFTNMVFIPGRYLVDDQPVAFDTITGL